MPCPRSAGRGRGARRPEGFGGHTICCAYVPRAGTALSPAAARERLAALVPRYMLPVRWRAMDRLPANANGKVDRVALRDMFVEEVASRPNEAAGCSFARRRRRRRQAVRADRLRDAHRPGSRADPVGRSGRRACRRARSMPPAMAGSRAMRTRMAFRSTPAERLRTDGAELCRDLACDWLINAYGTVIVPRSVLRLFPGRALNVHPGPLPDYGGLHMNQWALRNGESRFGATIHLIEERVDAGAIVRQAWFDIAPARHRAQPLFNRTQHVATDLLREVLGDIVARSAAAPDAAGPDAPSHLPACRGAGRQDRLALVGAADRGLRARGQLPSVPRRRPIRPMLRARACGSRS